MKFDKTSDARAESASRIATRSQKKLGKTASVGRMRLDTTSSTAEHSRQINDVEIISADGSSDCMIEEPLAPAPQKPPPVFIIDIDSSDGETTEPRDGSVGAASKTLKEQETLPTTMALTPNAKENQKKKKPRQQKANKAKSVDPRITAASGQMQLEPRVALHNTAAPSEDVHAKQACPTTDKASATPQLSKRARALNEHSQVREACRKLDIDEHKLRKMMQEIHPREKSRLVPKVKNPAMLIKLKKLIASSKKHGANSIVDYLLFSRDRLIGLTLYNSQASDPLISVSRLDSRSAC